MKENDIDVIMGHNLRRLRLARGLSQEELAGGLGDKVTKQRVSAIENGREGMGKNLLSKACEVLKAELWEFSWTEKTPIIKDAQEMKDIQMRREAGLVGIADMVREAEASWIMAAKKKGLSVSVKKSERLKQIGVEFEKEIGKISDQAKKRSKKAG